MKFTVSYLKLLESDELKLRATNALQFMNKCKCCPRNCGINRNNNELGFCNSSYLPIVSSFTSHHGEEPGLSGTKGAGNIFFGNCNLKCIYCQNFEISQNYKNEIEHEVSHERLAEIMLELQNRGCHNIGLVSPTHFSGAILKSIYIAAKNGLNVPIIYNSNGYDSVEILKLYDGVIDIYLPDFKYGVDEYAKKYSCAENYFESAKAAIKEMFRQVGPELVYDENVIVRGLIIRHLILPNNLAESENVFKFIAEELSTEVHISLMSQYYPTNKANEEILLDRKIRLSEYEKVLYLMEKYNLHNGWIQEMESPENYRPSFETNRDDPFSNYSS